MIPSYTKVHITSYHSKEVNKQLEKIEFGKAPYIFVVSHLGDFQHQVCESIQQFLLSKSRVKGPYPHYVLTNDINIKLEHITPITSEMALPSYFKQKVKQLNAKESTLLKQVKLKQQAIRQISSLEVETTLKDYTDGHRELAAYAKEHHFLDALNKNLKQLLGSEDDR